MSSKTTQIGIQILAFGIAKDIIGGHMLPLELPEGLPVKDLKAQLSQRFPEFEKLASLRIAVNSEYVDDDYELQSEDEVVLIPPVSGG